MPQATFRCSRELYSALNRFVAESSDYSRSQVLQSLLILYLKKPRYYAKEEDKMLQGPLTDSLVADVPSDLVPDLQNLANLYGCPLSHVYRMAIYQGVILKEL